jgi:N4-gp56 family major capsid protein
MSIDEKLDNDEVAVMYESKNVVDATTSVIKYASIVDGVDMFGEEEDSNKVIFIHSKQKTQLRKDPDFISADKFQSGVMVSGAIGRVAGCDVVVSNKVKLADGIFYNPIIKLDNDAETEDDIPAVTYFLKRGNLVEHKREEGVGDKIICTAFGMPALTNEAKVVILKTKEK